MYPLDKKDEDFNFKRVLQCFPPLAMYPFGLKGCKKINFLINAPFGRFSLAMYPSDHFFLKALFLRGVQRSSSVTAQGYMDKGTGASWAGFWLARWALRTWPRFPKIRAGFFLQFFSSSFSLKRPFSGDLSHSGFWPPCRSTLSGLRKAKNGASLAMYPLVGFA